MKNTLFSLLILLLVFSCKEESKTTTTDNSAEKSEAFATLLDNYYEEGLKLNPLSATSAGDNRYNDQLPNWLSDEYVSATKTYYNTFKERLDNLDSSNFSESEKMTKAILEWECDINLQGFNFRQDLRPIDQMWSPHLTIGLWASGAGAQPFKTVEDYNNWLKRLDGYTDWLHSAKSKMQEGIKTGNVLPKSLVLKVLPQLRDGAVENLDKHLFYTPIKNMPDSFSDEDKKTLTEAYSKKLKDKIIPAYRDLDNFMSTEYMKAARTTSGIDAIPDGKAYYNYMIKLFTTTNMTADEIHQLGLSEVARIRSEMEKIMNQVGFKGDLKAFFDHVRKSKELMPYTDPQQVIDNFNDIHERMKPQIEKLFGNKPKTPFEVRRVEAFR